ncbi:MAG TPA: DUF4326 domain-containing protein [Halococcus sp.]|nr:DUF4326 domain-containing protein [Halococcus sp.]
MKLKTTVGHAKHDEIDAYIARKDEGRETIQNTPPGECFGNPYRLENHSRGASIRKFADLLDTLLEERPIYRLYVRDLAGKTLGCWCRRVNEGEPACHGDVLAAKAGYLYKRMSTAEGETCERGDHWLVDYRQWRECVWCGTSAQDLSHGRAIDRTGADLWPDDDGDDDKAHRVSDVSDEDAESSESGDSGSDIPVEGGSGDANPGFEGDESTAHDQPDREQGRAAVATQRAPNERARKGGQG